ncbi:MAG: FAD-dependent oxidoreductase, partial [bacterium]
MTVSREESLVRLKAGEPFDLLVIGGGATGCGVALDAASRGLRTALLEKGDFAEGTSGRSTKLLHGGVRYLESAVKHLDPVQYRLVRDGLRERGVLLRIAPHLCHRIALVTPLYHWLEVPYILTGLKIYDLLAGNMGIGHSRLLSHAHALKRFPMLKERGLKAAVLYYDGQFNDARMAVLIALTAARLGAVVANHVTAAGFHREDGRISGVVARDSLTGEEWIVPARVVVNATGPFTDTIRVLDDPDVAPMLTVSSGIHMVLDKRFSPPDTGLLIPRTRDNRVLFILPWEGHAIIGTTDEPAQLSEHPRPTEEEVQYLTRYIGEYFDLDFSSRDIKATWSGLRPLLHDPKASDTARLSRDHIVAESPSGLVTVTGGKWTTYRLMAEHTVDYVVRRFGLTPRVGCRTRTLPIAGAE